MSATQTFNQLDSAISKQVFGLLDTIGWDINPISPLTKNLPLVASPSGLVESLAVYLFVVGLGVLFITPPKDPKARKPFFGEYYLVLLHNIILASLSIYMCTKTLYEAWNNKYSIWGNPYSPNETEMAKVIYVFYVSKIYELFDTVIMLGKKNLNQVSFLHVYHHGSISFIWWMISYKAPGGDAYFSCAANSFVHIWMYLYYLVAHVLPKDDKIRNKYLWWGKYLTQLQLTQFAANFCHAIWLVTRPVPVYPNFLSQLLAWYMVSLIALFGNFYIRKHLLAPKAPKPKAKSV